MQSINIELDDRFRKNIELLRTSFPNCIVESKDASGKNIYTVDFELLRQELSDLLVEGSQERYQLNWPGKSAALNLINSPSNKTLRPLPDASLNFWSSKNLFIEGDNFEALKLLQESYLGKIKVIYIDPPYNTGSDFLYDDDFSLSSKDFSMAVKELDGHGNRMVANTESNGRFHSDWLSMMYSRLKLARNLLKDDGIIFISIDDCEVANLRKLCDEIFGENNFFCTFVWKRRSGAMDSVDNVSVDHEYILAYGKIKSRLKGIARTYDGYKNPDNDPRGVWKADNLSAGKPGGDVYYPIKDPKTGNEFLPPEGRYWPYSRTTMANKIEEGRIIFPVNASGRPMLKRFKSEAKSETVPVSTWMVSKEEDKVGNSLLAPLNTQGTKELQGIFGKKVFDHPKSTQLIKSLLTQCDLNDGDIVMDFFAGSGTTADAVLGLNAEDGIERRFILIQLDEECASNSEAYKSGFKKISDISKARIQKLLEVRNGTLPFELQISYGVRCFKIDTSNFVEIANIPDLISQGLLLSHVNNILQGRENIDILFQVLLNWGVDLSLPIEKKSLHGKECFFLDGNAMIACFDGTGRVDGELVKEIAHLKPLRVVFRDAGFADDSMKINVEQIFKSISPHTEVKTI